MEPLFLEIGNDQPVTEMESLCMSCHENGTTRMMLTKIPHFKEIFVSSFSCPHCGNRNNSIQFVHELSDLGSKITLSCSQPTDFNRQVVVTEFCTVSLVEIDLELPPVASKTTLTTVEGILDSCIADLDQIKQLNQDASQEFLDKLTTVIEKLVEFKKGNVAFTLKLDDPSGNSYIQKYSEPEDPAITVEQYERTAGMMEKFGFAQPSNTAEELDDRLNIFGTICSNCGVGCDTRMCTVDIPHFKELLIMSTKCEACGFVSNEVKSGGAIPDKGRKITFHLTSEADLSRDFLKSDSCTLEVPEIDLKIMHGTLGSQFTTIEGILLEIQRDLEQRIPFVVGDSAENSSDNRIKQLADKIKLILAGQLPCTIVLDDPLGNSYIQNLYAPDEDPEMLVEDYERTFEQNEIFGLNDIQA